MNQQMLGHYVCPTCLGDLTFESSPTKRQDGVLSCTASHSFQISGGLPRFVKDEGYTSSFGHQWTLHRATQLDSSTHTDLSRQRFFDGTGWPRDLTGELVLEAGCGSGRFTEILASTGARILSFDYSQAAEVAFARFNNERVHVCQASIYAMPYRKGSFDRVFCYGVLQHCPDVKKAFFCLTQMLRPGGHLAVDVYDRRKLWYHSRYRFRWLTTRLNHKTLYNLCRKLVPLYMRFVPPLHPWNLLLIPIKDYRGVLPGLSRAEEVEWSILDTFDFLAPQFDTPQSWGAMTRWGAEAGLTDIRLRRAGNGIEVRARGPA